jgi:hypothetical protein
LENVYNMFPLCTATLSAFNYKQIIRPAPTLPLIDLLAQSRWHCRAVMRLYCSEQNLHDASIATHNKRVCCVINLTTNRTTAVLQPLQLWLLGVLINIEIAAKAPQDCNQIFKSAKIKYDTNFDPIYHFKLQIFLNSAFYLVIKLKFEHCLKGTFCKGQNWFYFYDLLLYLTDSLKNLENP